MLAIRWTLTMEREMGICKSLHIQKIALMISYHNLIPVKWIFWIGLETFVWLHLLDTGYDKHILIYPKICCRLASVKNKQTTVKWLCLESILNHTAFIKTNSIFRIYKIIMTMWWLMIIGKKFRILKVTLPFINIRFTNCYLTYKN